VRRSLRRNFQFPNLLPKFGSWNSGNHFWHQFRRRFRATHLSGTGAPRTVRRQRRRHTTPPLHQSYCLQPRNQLIKLKPDLRYVILYINSSTHLLSRPHRPEPRPHNDTVSQQTCLDPVTPVQKRFIRII